MMGMFHKDFNVLLSVSPFNLRGGFDRGNRRDRRD
jgi:hypothetical protein